MTHTEHLMSALGEESIAKRMNSFFPEVLDKIGLTTEQSRQHCDVRVRELPIHNSDEGKPLHLSDDRITELWVGERTVATIIELRTNLNFAQILLADYLTPELIAQLHKGMGLDENNPVS